MFKLIFALMVVIIGFTGREAFPCFNLDCSAANATVNCTKLDCEFGTTAGSWCSCCPVCAKGRGENCGDFIGGCAKGLQCCLTKPPFQYVIMGLPSTFGTCYSNSTSCPISTTAMPTTTTTSNSN